MLGSLVHRPSLGADLHLHLRILSRRLMKTVNCIKQKVHDHPVAVFVSASAVTFTGTVVMIRTSPAALKALAGMPQVARTLRLGA